MIRRPLLVGTSAVALALPMVPAAGWADDGGADVETRGTCSVSARWHLEVQPTAADAVAVEFTVDDATAGGVWDYTVTGPTGELANGTATASARGRFEVEAQGAGLATDVFSAQATSAGEVCDSTVGVVPGDDHDDSDGPHRGDDSEHPRGGRHDGVADDDDQTDSDDDGEHGTYDDDAEGDDDSYDTGTTSPSGRTIHEGHCTGASSLVLATSARGRTTLTVDSRSRGQKWRYSVKRGQKVLKQGAGRTRGRSGALVVNVGSAGANARATAVRADGSESCATSRAS